MKKDHNNDPVLARLRLDLDRRDLPYAVQDRVVALKLDGVVFLTKLRSDPTSSWRQLVNAMKLGFRMRAFGDRDAYVTDLLRLIEHENEQVRSTAASLLVGMKKMAEEYSSERTPSLNSIRVARSLRRALTTGVDAQARSLVQEALAAED